MQEMVEKIQTQLSENVESLRKEINDQSFEMKRITQSIEDLKQSQKN